MHHHSLSPQKKFRLLHILSVILVSVLGPVQLTHAVTNGKEISGVIFTYDVSSTGTEIRPVSGAQVALYYDDGDRDSQNDVLVSDSDLDLGQQSQVVDSDGIYQFNVTSPGAYLLKVLPADPLLAFPSIQYPPQNSNETGNSFGDTTTGGEVVSDQLADVLETRLYFLRFDLATDSEGVTNNYIPLDPLSERVSIQTAASLKLASVGDIVSYSTTIQNRSNGTISLDEGGVELVDQLPQGFELVKGSYGIFQVSTVNGVKGYTPIKGGPEPSGSFLRFGVFELKAQTDYEIRYNVRIEANALLGPQLNKAWVRKGEDETSVTSYVGVAVMISPDTLFTSSTVLGHVFCDLNQNQTQDLEESGIGGVSIYLDNGGHVVSDGDGLFHLSRISAGMHLAKIDKQTLPPASTPHDEGRAHFYLSAGLPGEISFPVQCNSQWVQSDQIELNENFFRPPGLPPRRLRDVQVTGNLSPFSLTLDSKTEEIGYVNLRVTAEGDSAKAKKRGPNIKGIADGELTSPLLFKTTFKKTDGLTWQLTILDLTEKPESLQTAKAVYFLAGQGRPPLYLLWDGKDEQSKTQLLEEGHRYGATMTFVTVEGHQIRSPIRVFGIKWRDPTEKVAIPENAIWDVVSERIIDATEGPLFDENSEPTERTKTLVKDLLSDVKEEYKLTILVHGFVEDEFTALNNTRIFADNVRDIALQNGLNRTQIEADGKGIEETLVVHMGLRNRQMNHRIELKVMKPPIPPLVAVKHMKWPELVSLHGQPATINKKTHQFDQSLKAEVGQPMILRMRASDGRYLQTIRVVGDKDIWAPEKPEKKVRKEKLTLYWPTARVRLGDGYFDITHAPVTLKPMEYLDEETASIKPVDEKAVSLSFKVRRAGALPWARWKIKVMEAGKIKMPGGKKMDARLEELDQDDGFKTVHTLKGLGLPPEEIILRGIIPDEEEPDDPKAWKVSPDKVYRVRISAETIYGDKLISNPITARIGEIDESLTAEQSQKEMLTAAFDGETKELSADLIKKLDETAAATKNDESILYIEVHTNDNGDEAADQLRSEQIGRSISVILKENGIPETRIKVSAMGARSLLDPGFSEFGAAKNRRIIIEKRAPADAFSEMPKLTKLKIGGKEGRMTGSEFSSKVKIIENRPIKLELWFAPGGYSILWLYPVLPQLFTGRPDAYAKSLKTFLLDWRTEEAKKGFTKPEKIVGEEETKPDKKAKEEKAKEEKPQPGKEESKPDPKQPQPVTEKADEKETPPADETEELIEPNALVGEDIIFDDAIPYMGEGTPPLWWPTRGKVPATKIKLWLPDEKTPISGKSFWVKGRAEPGTRVSVQGKTIPVNDETGDFQTLVHFDSSTKYLLIEGVDWIGNKVRWQRSVDPNPSHFFALVLADTAVGSSGTPLTELSDTNHVDTGDVLIYGRTAAWLKGHFNGGSFFSGYDLDLHLDSSRFDQDVYAPYMLSLGTNFPIFGDEATETFIPNARYPLYLKLDADASSVHVGNMNTNLQQGDYFKYNHPRYAVKMHLDKGWSQGVSTPTNQKETENDPWRTDTEIMVAGGDPYQQFSRNELRGTGTSLYFMRNTQLMEGSEVVTLLIRDRITGNIKDRIPQVRDRDYTIHYAEGHLLFNRPIPAYVNTDMFLNHQLASVSHGDPVSIEVGYGYIATEAFPGLTAGGRFMQRLAGNIDIGVGYLQETRETDLPLYQLGDALLKWRPTSTSEIELEYATSTGVDNQRWLSQDGGLTWGTLGQQPDDGVVQVGQIIYPENRAGSAYRIGLQSKLGHLFQKAPDAFLVNTWFKRVSLGFFSQDSVMSQGQTAWGTDIRGTLTDKDALRLRYDGIINEMPLLEQATASRALHRELLALAYDRKLTDYLTLQATYGFGYIWDEGNFPELAIEEPTQWQNHLFGLGAIWRPLDKLGIFARQEYYAGDYPYGLYSDEERLVAHLGADYQLTPSLSVGLLESVRFDGENHLSLRANWALTDSSQLYARQGVGYVQDGWMQTSVVGAQQFLGQGARTFAEYQLQNTRFGNAHQGVAGINTRFHLPLGFQLALNYEWIHRIGASGTANTVENYALPGALTDGLFFAAPSVFGGGDYLYGAMSRDAVSVNLFYQSHLPLIGSQRLEWRLDQFDELRGGFNRQWWLSNSALKWKIINDLEIFGRYNIANSDNVTAGTQEMYLEEGTFGLSYRPHAHNKYRVLAKMSGRALVHPASSLDGFSGAYLTQALSVEPVLELPFDLEWLDKLAYKMVQVQLTGINEASGNYILSINRINWKMLRSIKRMSAFDMPGDINLGAEYRILAGLGDEGIEQGWLFELQYAPITYFTLGLGYNMTSFSDDELDPGLNDRSGFYFRAVGYY